VELFDAVRILKTKKSLNHKWANLQLHIFVLFGPTNYTHHNRGLSSSSPLVTASVLHRAKPNAVYGIGSGGQGQS
jgi:hypothetical protein